MATISLLPFQLQHHHLSNPNFLPPFLSNRRTPTSTIKILKSRGSLVVVAVSSSESKNESVPEYLMNEEEEEEEEEEEGVVDSMDGYFNQLSLEYDSIWDTKPSCDHNVELQLDVRTLMIAGNGCIALTCRSLRAFHKSKNRCSVVLRASSKTLTYQRIISQIVG
ncbi:hypothetical protein GIB67_001877 [Kingdonia uniflora]|uniref:Uncharacterized protein n=1 Tax=Kingdonia uniflora TaxID=39325 RepID=A0A7J7LQD3_9MAGN|nr:hypothetical protein GIB67_001877 [Kingdonia uniflora]